MEMLPWFITYLPGADRLTKLTPTAMLSGHRKTQHTPFFGQLPMSILRNGLSDLLKKSMLHLNQTNRFPLFDKRICQEEGKINTPFVCGVLQNIAEFSGDKSEMDQDISLHFSSPAEHINLFRKNELEILLYFFQQEISQ